MTPSRPAASALLRAPLVVLAAALLASCIRDTPEPEVLPVVTAVRVEAVPAAVPPGGTAELRAVVEGTGVVDPGVSWSIESGEGTLSGTEGAQVTYAAPASAVAGPVVVRAVSRQDPAQSGTVTLTVLPGSQTADAVWLTAASTAVAPGGSSKLVAFVEGFGVTNRDVTWRLVSGAGALVYHRTLPGPREEANVRWFEPAAQFTGDAVVEATSVADPRRSARITLTVAPPSTDLIRVHFVNVNLVGPATRFVASVESTYEITSMVARVPGTDLQFPLDAETYPELPRGVHPLEVTVTDSRGNTLVLPVRFAVERPPVLQVAEPATWSVAVEPAMRFRASCVDDSGACRLGVSGGTGVDVHASAMGVLDTSLDLTRFVGGQVPLNLTAMDPLGQTLAREYTATVVSHPLLERVATVPGELLEAHPDRLLYRTGGGPSYAPRGLGVWERATGRGTQVPAPEEAWETPGGVLTPGGALVTASPIQANAASRLYDYRAGTLELLDPGQSPVWLDVAGDYAAWVSYPASEVKLRRLSTGSEVSLGPAGNIHNDVAANGRVVFWDRGYDIVTSKDGVTQRLTDDPDHLVWNIYPVTDGTLVLYGKWSPAGVTPRRQSIALHDGAQETILAPMDVTSASFEQNYALSAGWAAWGAPSATGVEQVWLRSPAGVTRQVTDFAERSRVEALGPEGQLAVRTGLTLRVSGAEGAQLEARNLGPTPARPVWLDGAWHLLWADTLYRVR